MAKKQKMLEDLFHETLKDIYYAEKKILTALPKMAKAAQSEDLQAAFEKHEGETKDQVERLEQIFELIRHPARGKTCDAIKRDDRRKPRGHEGVQGFCRP
jgi:ferritin-like metal-binding protein YciE